MGMNLHWRSVPTNHDVSYSFANVSSCINGHICVEPFRLSRSTCSVVTGHHKARSYTSRPVTDP